MPIFAVCVLRFGLYLYYPPLMVEKVKNARSLSRLLIKSGRQRNRPYDCFKDFIIVVDEKHAYEKLCLIFTESAAPQIFPH